MTRIYYVEIGEYAEEGDAGWSGPTDTWNLPLISDREVAFYPEEGFWRFNREEAVSDALGAFGMETVGDWDRRGDKPDMTYAMVSACDVPDDYVETLCDGESVAASGEQYVLYDGYDTVFSAYTHGQEGYIAY